MRDPRGTRHQVLRRSVVARAGSRGTAGGGLLRNNRGRAGRRRLRLWAHHDEPRVDVQSVEHTNDVAEQATEVVNTVAGSANRLTTRSGREKSLGACRCLAPVALDAEVHLGGVDLDEADALAVAKRDGAPFDHPIHAVHRRGRRDPGVRTAARHRASAKTRRAIELFHGHTVIGACAAVDAEDDPNDCAAHVAGSHLPGAKGLGRSL
jgi:hypothetical protein